MLSAVDPADLTNYLLAAVSALAVAIATGVAWYAKSREAKDAERDKMLREQQASHESIVRQQGESYESAMKSQRLEAREERDRQTQEFKQTLALIQQYASENNQQLKEEISALKASIEGLSRAIVSFQEHENARLEMK